MSHAQAHVGLCGLVLAVVCMVGGPPGAQAYGNGWGFGTDVGFISGTVHNTVFALNFQGDYYLAKEFSLGPLFQWVPRGDLKQYAFAGVFRYHYRVAERVSLVPFAGIGFLHADLDTVKGGTRIDRNDTSHYIPIGIGFEYWATRHLAFSNTVMVNLYDIDLSPSPLRDTTSVSVLFGLRFGP